MPAPTIQIRIIRDNANSLKDEIFTVAQGAHNDWRINHMSSFSQSSSFLYVKNRSDVLGYVHTVFDLLKVDDETYHFVQLDATCYPVIMVSRANILGIGSDTLNKLVRVVENSLDNWPAWVDEWST